MEKLAAALGTTPEVLTREEPPKEPAHDKKPKGDLALLSAAWKDLDEVNRQALLSFAEGLLASGQISSAYVAAQAAEAIFRRRLRQDAEEAAG